ncbi:MAG: hypothetical protein RMJ16_14255 [Thermoguttaceae bacterium]|nr:hypothetical protein [Thermoguttaceae bacterium]
MADEAVVTPLGIWTTAEPSPSPRFENGNSTARVAELRTAGPAQPLPELTVDSRPPLARESAPQTEEPECSNVSSNGELKVSTPRGRSDRVPADWQNLLDELSDLRLALRRLEKARVRRRRGRPRRPALEVGTEPSVPEQRGKPEGVLEGFSASGSAGPLPTSPPKERVDFPAPEESPGWRPASREDAQSIENSPLPSGRNPLRLAEASEDTVGRVDSARTSPDKTEPDSDEKSCSSSISGPRAAEEQNPDECHGENEIQRYLARLLERLRAEGRGAAPAETPSERSEPAEAAAAPAETSSNFRFRRDLPASVAEDAAPPAERTHAPAPMSREEVGSIRELASHSAQTALVEYRCRRFKQKALGKLGMGMFATLMALLLFLVAQAAPSPGPAFLGASVALGVAAVMLAVSGALFVQVWLLKVSIHRIWRRLPFLGRQPQGEPPPP